MHFSFHHLLLLLWLSRFSRLRLCVTPQMAAHQAPPSLGFSRQDNWSGLPFPSPLHKSESEVAQLCLTLPDPMDCSLPGSSVYGIFQARALEGVAISFSVPPSGNEFKLLPIALKLYFLKQQIVSFSHEIKYSFLEINVKCLSFNLTTLYQFQVYNVMT